ALVLPTAASARPSGEYAIDLNIVSWKECNSLPVAASHTRTLLSVPVEATVLPSGAKATRVTPHRWPAVGNSSLPLSTSHRPTSAPRAAASVLPSGENAATERTLPSFNFPSRTTLSVATSQTCKPPPVDANDFPSGASASGRPLADWRLHSRLLASRSHNS